MARMHARRRGKSAQSALTRKQAPSWSNTDMKAIEKVILELRKDGASSARSDWSCGPLTEFPI